jgi:hypothetical protein
MPNLTPEGLRRVAEIASRQGVSFDAAYALLDSLSLGNGTQAQFNHPDLGGMGQWSQGGMIMIGDMFNQGLKYRVDALCNELAGLLRSQPSVVANTWSSQSQSQGGGGMSLFVQGSGSGGQWWPAELGNPSSSGAQNDMRYAFFPNTRRIAIRLGDRLRVYDSGDHQLSGFSQQQGGDQSLTFTSQYGVVRISDLPEVSAEPEAYREPSPPPSWAPEPWTPPPMPVSEPSAPAFVPAPPAPVSRATAPIVPSPPAAPAAAPRAANEIFAILESLAALREKNIISEEEFSAKKAELLSRL